MMNKCFLWAITRALNPKIIHPERIDKLLKMQSEQFDMTGIDYPVSLKAIDIFKKQNPDISVYVFCFDKNEIDIHRRSEYESNNKVITLLLISDEEKQHYCIIQNMSRLLSSQTSNKKVKHHCCLNCLNCFFSKDH
ncbi:hypothetical protein ACF0H5_013231 [Mactra antiquata]